MDNQIKTKKGNKVLFISDIIMPIISIITLIIASLFIFLYLTIFNHVNGSLSNDEFVLIITSFILVVLEGIMISIPVYLYGALFFILLVLGILTMYSLTPILKRINYGCLFIFKV